MTGPDRELAILRWHAELMDLRAVRKGARRNRRITAVLWIIKLLEQISPANTK